MFLFVCICVFGISCLLCSFFDCVFSLFHFLFMYMFVVPYFEKKKSHNSDIVFVLVFHTQILDLFWFSMFSINTLFSCFGFPLFFNLHITI